MPLANLIHKVKLQQLFKKKNIYKTNLNVKYVCYSAFETSCTILTNFLNLLQIFIPQIFNWYIKISF